MKADSSLLSREVTPEQAAKRNEAQSSERVLGSVLTVTDGDYSGLHNLLEEIQRIVSSVHQFSLKSNDIDEHFTRLENLINERTMEMELRERSVKEQIVELEKKEEDVIERKRMLDMAVEEFDLKQKEWIESMSKDVEMVTEYLKQLEVREKELSLVDETIKEKVTELEKKKKIFEVEQKAKAEEIELKSREKMSALEKKEMIFEVEQRAKAEEVKESLKQLEAREKKLSLVDEAIKEKMAALEKKEKSFEVEQKAKAEEMELKSKEKMASLEEKEKIFEVKLKAKAEEIDVKEKKFEEREKELDLKQRELKQVMDKLKEREVQGQAGALIRPAKTHSHEDAACVVSASQEPKKINIVDSEFHDFKKTMSSFMVDKIWALYDPRDDMPRLYAKIKKITKYKSSLVVTWLDPKDEESVPVACGRFTHGRTETVSHLTFSHEVKPIIHGRNIYVNPREGETWAVFRQNKPPYRYDLVEVVEVFEDHQGVGVTYLGKVEGFVSVFKHAMQHGVLKKVIGPSEMHRFSHRVPSVRLKGREREGVPAGSFELDPAAVPSSILLEKREADDDVVQLGYSKEVPLIILD